MNWALWLVIASTFIGAFGMIVLKYGINRVKKWLSLGKGHIIVVGGIAIFLVSSLMTIFAYKGGEFSVLYPITSLTYLWTLFLAIILLKEKLNKRRILGVICILIGNGFFVFAAL